MAVTSSTDIGNLAMDLLGASTVNNIDVPTTSTESLLHRWYDQSRRKVLRGHPWNFASTRAQLAASSTVPPFGFTASFPVPNDFIRLNSVQDSEGNPVAKKAYTFENSSILSNVDSGILRIKYVYNITDVNLFDPLFIDLLCLDIAIGIAFKITDSNTNVQRIGELQKMRRVIAMAIDGQESPPERREVSKSIDARRSNVNHNSHRIIFG